MFGQVFAYCLTGVSGHFVALLRWAFSGKKFRKLRAGAWDARKSCWREDAVQIYRRHDDEWLVQTTLTGKTNHDVSARPPD